MTTLGWTPMLTDEPGTPARVNLRSGMVHRLSKYATVRLDADGPAPVTVFIDGEIDLASADRLAAILRAALDSDPRGMDLDLTSVRFCDVSGLRALLIARAHARSRGRHFALGPHSPAVARLLELTDTRSMLTVGSRSI
jgi:anti-anti-sigma factor